MSNKQDFYEKQSYRDLIGAGLSSRHLNVLEISAKYCSGRHINRILDLGCLDGKFSMLLGKNLAANEVYGVDISVANIENARSQGCKAFLSDLDSDYLPFDDASFDFIHMGDVIEHMYNPDNILREIHRLLTNDAVCIITTPNLAALANRIALLLGYQPFPVGTSLENDTGKLFISSPLLLGSHIRVFTYRAFYQLLHLHKLKVIKVVGMPLSSGGETTGRVKFVRFIERSLLASTLYKISPGLAWDLLFVLKSE